MLYSVLLYIFLYHKYIFCIIGTYDNTSISIYILSNIYSVKLSI